MNNFIEYFYGIKTDNIKFTNSYYAFYCNSFLYKLYIVDNVNINLVTEIDRKLLNNSLISQIIYNKDNQIISRFNNVNYILLKIYANPNKDITLEEISYLSNILYEENLNINWGILWSKKIDYLEELIHENGIKYPIIVNSFNYFVGMTENAIAYYNNIVIDPNYRYVISHKHLRINDTVEAIYNPLNMMFDYRVRDIAEYIKISFFKNNKNIMNELFIYLNNNRLSLMEVKLLIARILYPSFYFDMYEDILVDGKDETILTGIIGKIDNYEEYLSNIIDFFSKYYVIDKILWLKKKAWFSLHLLL